ncbi:MAG: hypothetical protein JO103_07815, partial [Candidatus Eremiobacteraeota bacterium]|nr:hypothetical protein [Candidatus Eremiobacteraeota bacterium]
MTSLRLPKSAIQPVGWTQLPGCATIVAASPDGSLWVLSCQGNGPDRSIWHYANGSWSNIPGAAMRLAVGPDGTLWVVNSAGGIYAYNGTSWTGIAGGASDITVGADGSVYVISNQGGGIYGRGIWRYSGAWSQLPGAAIRIAASWDTGSYAGAIAPGGFWVLNGIEQIYYYNPSSGFHQIPGAAVDLAPTTNGGLFVLGVPGGSSGNPIYYFDLTSGAWTQQPGAAFSIATNTSHVYVVGGGSGIYSAPVVAQPPQPTPRPTFTPTGTPLTGPTYGKAGLGWGPTALANALAFPVQNQFDGAGLTV